MSDALVLAHTVVVSLHAVAATTALASGIVAVHTGRGVALHQVGVLLMAGTLGPSLVLGWAGFPPPARLVFVGLTGLALAMVVVALRAGRVHRQESARIHAPVGPELVGVLGFNLISLTVAGSIVPVLRIGGGTLGVLVAVAVTVVLGHLLVERRRTQVVALVSGSRAVSSGAGVAHS